MTHEVTFLFSTITLGDLLKKRQQEIRNGSVTLDDQRLFYQSFMANIDTLISFKTWQNLDPRYDGPRITTDYIRNVNDLGQIYLNKSQNNSCK